MLTTPGHSLSDFIQTVLLSDLQTMLVDCHLEYFAFGTIACGIELLGACNDDQPWHQPGLSKTRFNSGIDTFMATVDARYQEVNNADRLYTNLRCGMAHVLRPQGCFALTNRNTAQALELEHLTLKSGTETTILVVEDLLDHFSQACSTLLEQLPGKTGGKFTETFLAISSLSSYNRNLGVSGI
jgi:hypothetical protein